MTNTTFTADDEGCWFHLVSQPQLFGRLHRSDQGTVLCWPDLPPFASRQTPVSVADAELVADNRITRTLGVRLRVPLDFDGGRWFDDSAARLNAQAAAIVHWVMVASRRGRDPGGVVHRLSDPPLVAGVQFDHQANYQDIQPVYCPFCQFPCYPEQGAAVCARCQAVLQVDAHKIIAEHV